MKLIWNLFFAFFKMGLFTFGGGLAMLPLIRDLAVNKKKWLTEEESVDCMAICQALPGVIAINSAIYIGNKQKGLAGAIAATFGVILPSFTIIIIAVIFLGSIGDNPYVKGAFEGVKAASAGLIAVTAYQMGKKVLKTKLAWIIAVISFCLIAFMQYNAIIAIIFGGLLGYFALFFKKITLKRKGKRGEE